MGKARKIVKKSIRLINNKTIRTTKQIKNHSKVQFRQKRNKRTNYNLDMENLSNNRKEQRYYNKKQRNHTSSKKLTIGRLLIIDILVLLLILAMFIFVRCHRGDISNNQVDYRHLDISGTWYKVNIDEMNKIIFTDDGKYEEQDMSGNKIKSGTYEIGEHLITFDKVTLSMEYVDEKKELRDAIDEDDISEYELNKYFYTDDKTRNKIYYFAEEDAAADCLEENLLSNSYYEKAGMFDKDGFAIDGEGTLLAYNGKAEEITIPQNVKRIAENAMSADYDRALDTKKVTILGNVKKIDAGAFSFSTIETVFIESGVEEIETWAFGDSKIKEIYFPDYITSLHAGILDTEEGLEDLKIHCKPGSQVEKYFKDNPPDGKYEIVE